MRTGVYVLVGPTETPGTSKLYVGEGDEVRTRLDSHHKNKDFWTRCYVLTTKDDSLNKAHGRYVEARLIQLAIAAALANMDNGTVPPIPALGEAEEADMESFIDNVLILFPLLGVNLFDLVPLEAPSQEADGGAFAPTVEAAPPLTSKKYLLTRENTTAEARDDSRGFTVVAGSLGRRQAKTMTPSYKALRDRLLAEHVLVPVSEFQVELVRTYVFESPSAAASVMAAGSLNGRDEWKDDKGYSLKQNQTAVST